MHRTWSAPPTTHRDDVAIRTLCKELDKADAIIALCVQKAVDHYADLLDERAMCIDELKRNEAHKYCMYAAWHFLGVCVGVWLARSSIS